MRCLPGVNQTKCGRYETELHIDETMRTFGVYDTAEEAARAYDR
jgi:hypothetical protein